MAPTRSTGRFRLAPSKIRPLAIDERLARRERLHAMLDGATRITLIIGPAGYGKTVTAAQWAQESGNTAWFTIDHHDNVPARFWRYVAAAINRASPDLGEETMGAIDDWAADGYDMVAVLLGELGDDHTPMALVLDDLHHVTSPEIVEQLEFFLERAPAWLRIVLCSRSVLRLPIARWGAQGVLTEIRQDDLALRPKEALDVVARMTFLDLDESTCAELVELAGGWPAALQLTGLSLRGRDRPDEFVREQLGSDRVLFDFVAGEVLGGLSPAHREAVLALSLLDDIDARRCEAVTGCRDGEALLHELVALGLPLVALGTDRRTFRFHHLFRALVRLELHLTDPAVVAELRRRAANAELQAGDHPSAVRHLLAVGDHETAFDLVFEPVWDLYRVGSMHELSMWLDEFPPDFVGADPARVARLATTLSLVGRLMEAEMWNEQASALAADQGVAIPDLVISRMLVHLGQGDTAAVRAAALELVVDGVVATDVEPGARYASIMVIAALVDGRVAEAAEWLDAVRDSRLRPERLRAVGEPTRRAWWHFERGALDQADASADLGLDGAGDGRGAPHALVELHITKAAVAVERHDLESARRWSESAVELASVTGSPLRPILHHQLAHAVLLGAIELEHGLDAALDALRSMASVAMAEPLAARYRIVEAELLARAGRWEQSERVVERCEPSRRAALVSARIALGRGHSTLAVDVLDRASDAESWPLRHRVEALLLRHRADPRGGIHLRRAVELGAPLGLVTTFRREGPSVDAALADLFDTDSQWRSTPLAAALRVATRSTGAHEWALVEPLSARELEVLQLLPTHLSTVELARRMYVSANTIRTHVKTIYRKLGVNSRTDAVRRAVAMGLLADADVRLTH